MKTGYWAPTPKKWRKIGDALLATASISAIGGLWQFDSLKEVLTVAQIRALVMGSIVVGVVGKFITNLFKEDTQN